MERRNHTNQNLNINQTHDIARKECWKNTSNVTQTSRRKKIARETNRRGVAGAGGAGGASGVVEVSVTKKKTSV